MKQQEIRKKKLEDLKSRDDERQRAAEERRKKREQEEEVNNINKHTWGFYQLVPDSLDVVMMMMLKYQMLAIVVNQ